MIFGVFVLIVVCLVGLLVARLRNAPAGPHVHRRALQRARRVGRRASTSRARSCSRSGCRRSSPGSAAALFAYQQQTISPPSFAVFTSLALLAVTYVAGVGRIAGAVVAGIMLSGTGLLVTALDKAFSVGKYQAVVAGMLLTLTAIKQPDGIAREPAAAAGEAVARGCRGRAAAARRRRRRCARERRARSRRPVGRDLDAALAFYAAGVRLRAPSSRSSCPDGDPRA